MTSKADWIALAERCTDATGSDQEIDGAIFDALSLDLSISAEHLAKDKRLTLEWLPKYSASLDAITALIARELPEVQWLCRTDTLGGFGNLYRRRNPDRSWPCFAFTPALALCAAFCRAMAEKVAS
jgi:hypothetical protein